MEPTTNVISPPERPLVPLYLDVLACPVCGRDGHGARDCPLVTRAEEAVDTEEAAA